MIHAIRFGIGFTIIAVIGIIFCIMPLTTIFALLFVMMCVLAYILGCLIIDLTSEHIKWPD